MRERQREDLNTQMRAVLVQSKDCSNNSNLLIRLPTPTLNYGHDGQPRVLVCPSGADRGAGVPVRGKQGCWRTRHRQRGAQRVQLGGGLVRIHAVAQGQLGHTPAVLPPEVVGDGVIVLCRVCEGLCEKEL